MTQERKKLSLRRSRYIKFNDVDLSISQTIIPIPFAFTISRFVKPHQARLGPVTEFDKHRTTLNYRRLQLSIPELFFKENIAERNSFVSYKSFSWNSQHTRKPKSLLSNFARPRLYTHVCYLCVPMNFTLETMTKASMGNR